MVDTSRAVRRAVASTKPRSSGLWFLLGGAGMTFLGLMLSATVIGAICGIPLLLAGVPMLIYGSVRYRQHQLEQLKQSIREGIVDGTQGLREGTRCPSCGHLSRDAARFCGGCGTALPD